MSGYYVKREGYKKPDVNAPRFRRERLNVLTPELYQKFKRQNPEINIDYQTFRRVILSFNKKIWTKVLENREGVELPERLGYIFIGTCPKASGITDPITSAEYDRKIDHKNWDSNQYVCKIFYSNYGTKYKFANSSMWYFVGCRKFKRAASASFIKNWNRYVKVSPISKVSNFFKDKTIKGVKVQKHDYNNRRVNFTDSQPD